MGEGRKEAFRVGFDRSVKIEFRGSRITSDAGLLAFRELDEALRLTGMGCQFLADTRTGGNTRFARPTQTIGLQPLGGLRGYKRCRTALQRSGNA